MNIGDLVKGFDIQGQEPVFGILTEFLDYGVYNYRIGSFNFRYAEPVTLKEFKKYVKEKQNN